MYYNQISEVVENMDMTCEFGVNVIVWISCTNDNLGDVFMIMSMKQRKWGKNSYLHFF